MTFPLDLLLPASMPQLIVGTSKIEFIGLAMLTRAELDYKVTKPSGEFYWKELMSQGRPTIDLVLNDPNRSSFF
jgi:hypothetical protein